MMSFEVLFKRLVSVAESKGFTIHDICFRVAGVGVLWCDQKRLNELGNARYKESLVVYRYYPTLRKAVEAEIKRVKALRAHETAEGRSVLKLPPDWQKDDRDISTAGRALGRPRKTTER